MRRWFWVLVVAACNGDDALPSIGDCYEPPCRPRNAAVGQPPPPPYDAAPPPDVGPIQDVRSDLGPSWPF